MTHKEWLEQLKAVQHLPPIPDDPGELPAWGDNESHGVLSHSKVARVIGEFGLAILQATNAAAGRPDHWPLGGWDGLAGSSQWSCIRVGLKALAQLRAAHAALTKEPPHAD